MKSTRIIVDVNAKNKVEAVSALNALLEAIEKCGPDEAISFFVEVVDEEISEDEIEKEKRA